MKDRYQPPPSAREGMRYQAPPSAADQAPKLTPAERFELRSTAPEQLSAKTLAHIDTLTEDRAALVEQAAYYKRESERLTAESERLRARLDAALAQVRERAGDYNAAESRLATAVGLLQGWLETADSFEWNASEYEDTVAFLASAQPAAPARKADMSTWHEMARDAAMAKLPDFRAAMTQVSGVQPAAPAQPRQQDMTEDEYYAYQPAAPAGDGGCSDAVLRAAGVTREQANAAVQAWHAAAAPARAEADAAGLYHDRVHQDQPGARAAKTARTEAEPCEWGPHCPACREERGENARTEAEQAVLDACECALKRLGDDPPYYEVDLEMLGDFGRCNPGLVDALNRWTAELARREAVK